MQFALWSALIGVLLVGIALSQSVLARLPLSTSMFYLLAGVVVSPIGFGLARVTPVSNVVLLEHVAEVVVLVSLFTSGMKMSVGVGDGRWLLPVRLAVVSMLVTVGLVAAAGMWLLGLSLGAAVLLGAILAPTDPVLASDVQVAEPTDRDRLRFSLTGEAGLNDGTAFPLFALGLGLLGLQDLGTAGWRWVAVDVVWFVVCGIAVGALLGSAIGKLVLYLRRTHKEATGLDNFLALGLIALAYGITQLLHGGGFLAVFAAGVALRRIERRETFFAGPQRRRNEVRAEPAKPGTAPDEGDVPHSSPAADQSARAAAEALASPDAWHAEKIATDQRHAPAFMAHAVLTFNEQIERIGEFAAVTLIGMLLWAVDWHRLHIGFIVLLLVLIRPLSVAVGLAGSQTSLSQRALIGWFGIRGVGSLYYLMAATHRGLDPQVSATLVALTFAAVVASITLHGVSVTPLMAFYERSRPLRRRGAARNKAEE
jgi:NhaP-type Na+/H+ or K+/H+ antiporter